jgi:hypothetical protein
MAFIKLAGRWILRNISKQTMDMSKLEQGEFVIRKL